MPNRPGIALSAIVTCIALQGCALNAKRWYAEIPLQDEDRWQVLYANHWRDRVDSLVVANCTPDPAAAKNVSLIRARVAAIDPPERDEENRGAPQPTDERYGEPLDLSAVNARRLLIIESGESLAARADGIARVCIRLARTESIDLGHTTQQEHLP